MVKYREVPWKRNLRKIPESIREQLKESSDKRFVVGVVKTISNSDLEAGTYRHLGLGLAAGGIILKERVVPIAEMGIFSRRNREGWEIRRDDLPMVTRTFSIETPNYGDWGNGSHTMEWDRECHQYDYVEAPLFAIHVKLLKKSSLAAVISFSQDWPLDRASEDFERDLLFALNILQENIGAAGLLTADASSVDLLALIERLRNVWTTAPLGRREMQVQLPFKAFKIRHKIGDGELVEMPRESFQRSRQRMT